MESHLEVVLILLDLAKAFDKVSHRPLLINKLKSYSFDDKYCNWIKSFLSNRKQIVVIGKGTSELPDVLSGVLQESVIGSLLF